MAPGQGAPLSLVPSAPSGPVRPPAQYGRPPPLGTVGSPNAAPPRPSAPGAVPAPRPVGAGVVPRPPGTGVSASPTKALPDLTPLQVQDLPDSTPLSPPSLTRERLAQIHPKIPNPLAGSDESLRESPSVAQSLSTVAGGQTSPDSPGGTALSPGDNEVHLDHRHLEPGETVSLLSHSKTLHMYRENAMKTNDPSLQYELAVFMLDVGRTLETTVPTSDNQDPMAERDALIKEAVAILRRLGDRGHVESQYLVGDCMMNGFGTPRGRPDFGLAYAYFSQAGKRGHPDAAYRTGTCYEKGWGCRRDAAKAVQFYRTAASRGHPGAQYRLGTAELNGELGLKRSAREGVKWLKRSAECATPEFPHALHELALLHEKGVHNVLFIDNEYSCDLLAKAVEMGYAPSAYKLGVNYEYGRMGCPQDSGLSIHMYNIAAQQNHKEACFALTAWYLVGAPGILPQSDTEAFLWAKRAAVQGLGKAEYACGYFAENGIGTPKDPSEAKGWYQRALEHGDSRASQRLSALAGYSAKQVVEEEAAPPKNELSAVPVQPLSAPFPGAAPIRSLQSLGVLKFPTPKDMRETQAQQRGLMYQLLVEREQIKSNPTSPQNSGFFGPGGFGARPARPYVPSQVPKTDGKAISMIAAGPRAGFPKPPTPEPEPEPDPEALAEAARKKRLLGRLFKGKKSKKGPNEAGVEGDMEGDGEEGDLTETTVEEGGLAPISSPRPEGTAPFSVPERADAPGAGPATSPALPPAGPGAPPTGPGAPATKGSGPTPLHAPGAPAAGPTTTSAEASAPGADSAAGPVSPTDKSEGQDDKESAPPTPNPNKGKLMGLFGRGKEKEAKAEAKAAKAEAKADNKAEDQAEDETKGTSKPGQGDGPAPPGPSASAPPPPGQPPAESTPSPTDSKALSIVPARPPPGRPPVLQPTTQPPARPDPAPNSADASNALTLAGPRPPGMGRPPPLDAQGVPPMRPPQSHLAGFAPNRPMMPPNMRPPRPGMPGSVTDVRPGPGQAPSPPPGRPPMRPMGSVPGRPMPGRPPAHAPQGVGRASPPSSSPDRPVGPGPMSPPGTGPARQSGPEPMRPPGPGLMSPPPPGAMRPGPGPMSPPGAGPARPPGPGPGPGRMSPPGSAPIRPPGPGHMSPPPGSNPGRPANAPGPRPPLDLQPGQRPPPGMQPGQRPPPGMQPGQRPPPGLQPGQPVGRGPMGAGMPPPPGPQQRMSPIPTSQNLQVPGMPPKHPSQTSLAASSSYASLAPGMSASNSFMSIPPTVSASSSYVSLPPSNSTASLAPGRPFQGMRPPPPGARPGMPPGGPMSGGPPRPPFAMGAPGRPPVQGPPPGGRPGMGPMNASQRESGSNASTPKSMADDEQWADAQGGNAPTNSGVARPPKDVPDLVLPDSEGEAQPRKKWFGFM
ncbi:Chitin synthase 4 [Malassezia equina]|uniref:Chitin synthase 4 n=1 Tax=Malassezia equina TaxID=1381935 RepID=A0AAF0EBG4_9BASI|nr:Chitin synthase 4 [Malassezia equina]